jgi:hypothetical protein
MSSTTHEQGSHESRATSGELPSRTSTARLLPLGWLALATAMLLVIVIITSS